MNPLRITETVLRDGHQSLLATRLRTDDMLAVAGELDRAGFWALDCWGGATFDVCIRYLGEDPWERLRRLKAAIRSTPLMMLLRGQNLVGYRPYPDDIVEAFVARAAENGIGVFRIFDAMNDPRNLEVAVQAARRAGAHAQGAMAYTVSPVHSMKMWVEMGIRLQAMGCQSVCILDMAGLLPPYVAEELVSRLKSALTVPVALQSHATTGMSTATLVKAVEAGLDIADTAISPMSLSYGISPTESVVTIFRHTDRDPRLDPTRLERIASHFRGVRRRYAAFEGSLKGADARLFMAQVPGGMLTNLEDQLRRQGAAHLLDVVLAEIPRVREDLGYPALITPVSQVVAVQAVLNVLDGERYRTLAHGTASVLRGEYGATPAPVNPQVQAKALRKGEEPITGRAAQHLAPGLARAGEELRRLASECRFALGEHPEEDVLTHALFPRVGVRFLENRGHPEAFEPPPPAPDEVYSVISGPVREIHAPLSGVVLRILVEEGAPVAQGEGVAVMEAMKMEMELRAPRAGVVSGWRTRMGGKVKAGEVLCEIV